MSEQRSQSNSSRFMLNGIDGYVRLRKCNCVPGKYFDMRFSQSDNNRERFYYRCGGCAKFDWVGENEVLLDSDIAQSRLGSDIVCMLVVGNGSCMYVSGWYFQVVILTMLCTCFD